MRISHFKSRFQVKHYAVVALGIIILVIITLLNHGDTHANTSLTLNSSLIIKYFIASMCASSAMLLPGISGSFMLLVFGAYGTVMFAISELMSFNFQAISLLFVVGLGIVAGFICSSKVIHYALHHYPTLTFALIIGFVIGSVFAVFPGMPMTLLSWLISIITLILGFIVSFVLGQITAKMKLQHQANHKKALKRTA